MIKNIILYSITLSTIASAAVDTQTKTSYTLGDAVHITTCNTYNWCKLQDRDAYVMGFHFKRTLKDPSVAIKYTKGTTYTRKMRPILKDDKLLLEFIKKETPSQERASSIKDYHNGYVKERDIEKYKRYLQAHQTQKIKRVKNVKKAVPHTKESPKKSSLKFRNFEFTNAFGLERVSKKIVQTKKIPYSLKNVKLQGLYKGSQGGVVIINDIKSKETMFLALFDEYKGYKLVEIYPKYVIFLKDGKRYTLKL